MLGIGQHGRDALAQGRNPARTTGEEHRVHLLDTHAGIAQQLRHAVADAFQLVVDGLFKHCPAQVYAQARFHPVQRHMAAVVVGQFDFGLLDFHRQPMPCALFDQLEQTVDTAGVFDVVAHAAQRQLGFLRVHRVDGVPGRQVHVMAGGHVGTAFHAAAVAEQWHYALQA